MPLRNVKLVAASFLLSGVMLTVASSPAPAQTAPDEFVATTLSPDSQYEGTFLKGDPTSSASTSLFVKITEQSVAAYDGHIPGLAATSPTVTGRPLDLASPEARAYLDHLNAKIDESLASLQALVPEAEVLHRYDVVLGGYAVRVPVAKLDRLARVANVQAVLPDELQEIDTYRSPEFIGAPTTWEQLGGQTSAGEGVVVGILDSGIWPEHPSFSDPDPQGNPYPEPPADWAGTACEFGAAGGPTDDAFDCNNKLIGADRFMATYETFVGLEAYEYRSARDDDGHGTHTASTAAGNAGAPAAAGVLDFGTFSGVAPRAHIAAYKVCGELGCYGTDSAAAIQQAILDGVDVLNFSISGGANPYGDVVSLAFLDAYTAGVFVAASAGNTGPGANTVNHRAGWITTVAASTSDQAPLTVANLVGTGASTLDLTGVSVTAGLATPAEVVVNTADPLCLSSAPPGAFVGKVVVCQRGVNARVAKSANVAAGGAVGMLLYNATPSSVDADSHSIPTIHVNSGEGAQLLAFLGANPGTTVSWATPQQGSIVGDVIAGFSSRGGDGLSLGIAKPDLTAPGVNILAAYTAVEYGTPVPYNAFLSGTSMSGPHVAGAGALIRDLYPDFTPGQIKSSLMTTAAQGVVTEDGITPATPFETGSGRVDLAQAWNPGITFDVSAADYLADEGQLWKVNYPSLYLPTMYGATSVERTARNVTSEELQYQLSVEYPDGQPADFSVGVAKNFQILPGATHTFTIDVDGRDVPLGEVRHATIVMRENGGQAADLRFPVTLLRTETPFELDTECTPAVIARKAVTDCTVTMTNNTFDAADVSMTATLPQQLQLQPGTVVGGTAGARSVSFAGDLSGAEPPSPSIAPGTSPAGGYVPLSGFGIAPIAGVGDETISNFNVPAFTYAGETYTRIGIVSNGYAVVGGGSGADVDFINQLLPNEQRPNNVLAPFWTDLNPAAGGALRAGTLTDGVNTWLVLDWEAVKEYSSTATASFQIWIDLDDTEGISYTYGTLQGNGDGGFLTVGAENAFGNRGASYYADGVGTLPAAGTELQVSSVPGQAGETKVVAFRAVGAQTGVYTMYAELASSLLDGTSTASFSGGVTKK
jgi:subtilisin family serine protease